MGQESSQMDKEAECNANANDDLKRELMRRPKRVVISNLCGRKKIPWPYPNVMAS